MEKDNTNEPQTDNQEKTVQKVEQKRKAGRPPKAEKEVQAETVTEPVAATQGNTPVSVSVESPFSTTGATLAEVDAAPPVVELPIESPTLTHPQEGLPPKHTSTKVLPTHIDLKIGTTSVAAPKEKKPYKRPTINSASVDLTRYRRLGRKTPPKTTK